MNKIILSGRLTADPEVRYTSDERHMAIARYTLAVDRRYKHQGEQSTDFIRCVAFGKVAEFAEKYLEKGKKIIVSGRLQIESYTNKNGQRMTSCEIAVEEQEFADSKGTQKKDEPKDDEFMEVSTEELPFV